MEERWRDDDKINKRKADRKAMKDQAKYEKMMKKQEVKELERLEDEKLEEDIKPKKRKNR